MVGSDVDKFWNMISRYSIKDDFNFEGIWISRNAVNPDVFFNVVYPWLHRPMNFRKSEIRALYRKARRAFPSLSFFADNRLHLVQKNGIKAHGVPYFYQGCVIKKGDVVLDLGSSPVTLQ